MRSPRARPSPLVDEAVVAAVVVGRRPRWRRQRLSVLQRAGRAAEQARSERPAGRSRWLGQQVGVPRRHEVLPGLGEAGAAQLRRQDRLREWPEVARVRRQRTGRRGRRGAARRRLLQGDRVASVADDGSGLVPARHEVGHRRRSSRRTPISRPRCRRRFASACSSSVRATITSSISTSRCRRIIAKERGSPASSGSTRRNSRRRRNTISVVARRTSTSSPTSRRGARRGSRRSP